MGKKVIEQFWDFVNLLMDNKLQDIYGMTETLTLPLIGVRDLLATCTFLLLEHEM